VSKRTGKFGAMVSIEGEQDAIEVLKRTLWDKINDGRSYGVNVSLLKWDDSDSHFAASTMCKARISIWLANWRDAEVEEFCKAPDTSEWALFERGERENPDYDNTEETDPTERTYTMEDKTFVGFGIWKRIR